MLLASKTIGTKESTTTLQSLKEQSKVKPFGAHFTTKLSGVNSKLVCALSSTENTCWDDACGGQPLCEQN